MTLRTMAEVCGIHPPHITDYLGHDDAPKRRDMPARYIGLFQSAAGNTAIAQWLAGASALSVAEERHFFEDHVNGK